MNFKLPEMRYVTVQTEPQNFCFDGLEVLIGLRHIRDHEDKWFELLICQVDGEQFAVNDYVLPHEREDFDHQIKDHLNTDIRIYRHFSPAFELTARNAITRFLTKHQGEGYFMKSILRKS